MISSPKRSLKGYSSLNVQEIEYAFRSFGSSVKDWGKSINLTLIDEVLRPYLHKRAEVRKMEESAIKPPAIEAPIEPVDMEKFVEDARSIFLKTKLVGLIPVQVYEKLEKDGDIDLTLDEKKAIRARVEKRLLNEAEKEGPRAVIDFRNYQKNLAVEYEKKVRMECKKQAAAEYFIKQNEIDNF
jgi:hypothetical protein